MDKNLLDFVRSAKSQIDEITIDEFFELKKSQPDLFLIDVREESEYSAGHIENAKLIPRGILEGAADKSYKKRDLELCEARDRHIVLYCATSGRSAMATATLKSMGFGHVYNLLGGFELWEAEDYPVSINEK